MTWEQLDWEQWIGHNRGALTSGAKLEVPRHFGHLAHAGFRPTQLASPEGQVANWTLPREDGSRIHVHVYPDGRRVAHRDKYDPDRGIGPALAHLAFDTPYVVIGTAVFCILMASSSTTG